MNLNPVQPVVLEDGSIVGSGWIDNPAARIEGRAELVRMGNELTLSRAAGELFDNQTDPEKSVFLWEAEQKVLNRIIPHWNQNPIGSCVGFGSTWAAQDVLINEVAAGEAEEWPGAELCPEITYVGSRHEARPPGMRPLRGEGSFGVAAGRWFNLFGVVKRGVYHGVDFTKYNRDWVYATQYSGIPDELGIEAEAKLHPITAVAQISTFEDFWVGVGARKGAYFCSVLGFSMNADSDGFAVQRGRWGHCQVSRGRCVAKRRGKWVRAMIGQTSWRQSDGGATIFPNNGPVRIETKDRGFVTLPAGMILYDEDTASSMFEEGDSFLLAGLSGWKVLTLDLNPLKS